MLVKNISVNYIKNSSKRLYRLYIEAKSYIYNIVKPIPSNQTRLLIFGQGRSGSTVLEKLICSTGYFYKNGELLNTDKGEILHPMQYIEGLSKIRSAENFVFHVKIYQLSRDRKHPIDPAIFLNALYRKGWKIIYLRRKNKVNHALSGIVAKHRGAYHKYDDKIEKYRLNINCEDFKSRVKTRLRFEKAERKALAGVKFLEVLYEDDLEKAVSHRLTINKILDYVSLKHQVATTNHRKVNTQTLKELIINYDEFVDCLIQHGWGNYLEGPSLIKPNSNH